MPDRLPRLVALAVTACVAASPALATDASQWSGDARSSVRLVAGALQRDTGQLTAGVALRLKPGWVTYWRYPGDAGVPPHFDFSASANVKAAEVRWPAPKRFEKGGVESIGYDADVTFPVHVVPQDPAKPVILRLKFDYGICEKLCIPAEAKVELPLSGASGHPAQLKAAEDQVPKRVAIGPRDGLAITQVRREGDQVTVSVDAADAGPVDLFVEGPTQEWAFPLPKRAGPHAFTFALDGAPTGATYRGTAVTLTAVSQDHAIEVVTPLQ